MEVLIGIVGVAVLCFLLSALWDFTKKTEKEQQWQAVQMQDRKRKQQAEEEAERYRTSLVKRYKNSPLTREILKTICDGTERNPEEIVIDKSGASGRTDGMVRSYDFLAHRVPELTDSKAFNIKSTRHFPACSHYFPKAGEARFHGRSRLFAFRGRSHVFPYSAASRCP